MFNSLKILVPLISFFLCVFLPLRAVSQPLGFMYFADKETIARLWLNPIDGSLGVHHLSYPTKFISDSDFFVIESEPLKLAIPKKMSAESWVYAGQTYENLGQVKIKWRGKQLVAYRITLASSDQVVAIYNVRFGVLGFERVSGKGIEKIWLRGRCGYGALGCE